MHSISNYYGYLDNEDIEQPREVIEKLWEKQQKTVCHY